MQRNTSVTLYSHFDEFVGEKVAQWRFHSISEVVRVKWFNKVVEAN